MHALKEKIRKIFYRIKNIKLKKIHLEYITAILSIPVLVTAILINVGNLTNKNEKITPTPTAQVKFPPFQPQNQNTSPTAQICKKSIGPISITSPTEDQSVTDNPVCFIIDYSDTNYCSVVWSYRVNDGTWSDYNSNSPCLYNLPNGDAVFELRVKSTVINEQKILTRSFKYTGNSNVATPTPSTTSTPTLTPTSTTTPTISPTTSP